MQKGQEAFDAIEVVVNSEVQVQCKFPVNQMSPGVWDVVVVMDSRDYLLPNGFEIQQAGG